MAKPPQLVRPHQADVSMALFLAAGLTGIFSLSLDSVDPTGAEMMTLAQSIADHGSFANPFNVLATGPTAMNPPLYPFMVAGLMKLLRVPELVAGAALLGSVVADAFTAALLPRVSVVFFGNMLPGVIASTLWIAAMPMLAGWDTSYTALGLLVFVLITASLLDRARPSTLTTAALAGLIAGLLFLFNPSSLLITLPWVGYLVWRLRSDLSRSVRFATVAVSICALFIAGWAARNHHQLGAFVVRTNLGATLYASNNDCAQPSMFRDQLNGCYQAHHPNASLPEAQLVAQLGEVRYDRMRVADTRQWIRSHPQAFFKLTSRRFLQFWFPATQELPTHQDPNAPRFHFPAYMRNWLRHQNAIAYSMWLSTALSLWGLVLMVHRRLPVTLYIVAVLAIYPLMYYTVVSDMRYRYPVLWLSLLPAGYAVTEAITLFSRRKAEVHAEV